MARRDRPRPRPGIRDPRAAARGDRPDARPGGSTRRGQAPDPHAAQTVLDRLTLALLPLRAFLGATFLYAGLDKLIDPTFLRTSGPGSIAAQLEAFVHVSPIAFLVRDFGQPIPILVGVLISIAEIAIGLGALTGLLFRLSAVGGAALSVLFWLTASWATRPYYYGADLPYAFGWLTLALAGHGGRFVLGAWLAELLESADRYGEPASPERRHFLEGGILGLAALVVAGIGGTLGASIFGRALDTAAEQGSPAPSGGAGSGLPPGTAGGSPSPASGTPTPSGRGPTPPPGQVIGRVQQVTAARALAFTDPRTGDPGVVVRLPNGTLVAFDAVCTHAGCTVEFDPGSRVLFCPCHGATFDPSHGAAVLGGPTDQPLPSLPIRVDTASGTISLSG